MALYNPDYKYVEAKKVIEELGDSEKDMAIKYYIEKHKEWHEEDKKLIERYSNFFKTLNSLLPKSNMRLG